jgi:hypothetical protein
LFSAVELYLGRIYCLDDAFGDLLDEVVYIIALVLVSLHGLFGRVLFGAEGQSLSDVVLLGGQRPCVVVADFAGDAFGLWHFLHPSRQLLLLLRQGQHVGVLVVLRFHLGLQEGRRHLLAGRADLGVELRVRERALAARNLAELPGFLIIFMGEYVFASGGGLLVPLEEHLFVLLPHLLNKFYIINKSDSTRLLPILILPHRLLCAWLFGGD